MANEICAECHGVVKEPDGFHPYLFCELVKLGHHDPGAYLRLYGFTWRNPVAAGGAATSEEPPKP